MFEQGGENGRYVNFGRISPGRLLIIKYDGADYVGIKNLSGGAHKVAVGIELGMCHSSNLTTGDRFEAESNASRLKKVVRLFPTPVFTLRAQACISMVFGAKDESMYAQITNSYTEFSTKLVSGKRSIIFDHTTQCLLAINQGVHVQKMLQGANSPVKVVTKTGMTPKIAGQSVDSFKGALSFSDEGEWLCSFLCKY